MIALITMAAASTVATQSFICESDNAKRPQPAALRISIVGVEVKPPKHVLPMVHGGKQGWFQLRKTVVTDAAITGKIPANLAANANLLFDRISLRLSISGAHGDYTGICVADAG